MANPAQFGVGLGLDVYGPPVNPEDRDASQMNREGDLKYRDDLPQNLGLNHPKPKKRKMGFCCALTLTGFGFCTSAFGSRLAAVGQHFWTDAGKGIRHEVDSLKKYRTDLSDQWRAADGHQRAAMVAIEPLKCLLAIPLKPLTYLFTAVTGLLGAIIHKETGKEWGQGIGISVGELFWKGVCGTLDSCKDLVIGFSKRATALVKHMTVDVVSGLKEELQSAGHTIGRRLGVAVQYRGVLGTLGLLKAFGSAAFDGLAYITTLPVKIAISAVGGALGAIIDGKNGKEWGHGLGIAAGELLHEGLIGIATSIKDSIVDLARFFGRRGMEVFRNFVIDGPKGAKAECNSFEEFWYGNFLREWDGRPDYYNNTGLCIRTFFRGVTTLVLKPLEYAMAGIGGAVGALIGGKEGKEWGQGLGIAAGELLLKGALGIGETLKDLIVTAAQMVRDRGLEFYRNIFVDAPAGAKAEWRDLKASWADFQPNRIVRPIDNYFVKCVEFFFKGLTAIALKPIEYALAGIGGAVGALLGAKKGKEWGQGIGIAAGELLFKGAVAIGEVIVDLLEDLSFFVERRVRALLSTGEDIVNGFADEWLEISKHFTMHVPNKFYAADFWGTVYLIPSEIFIVVSALATKPLKYALAGVLGTIGAILFAQKGKEVGQNIGAWVGNKLLEGLLLVGDFIGERLLAITKEIFDDMPRAIGREFVKAYKHACSVIFDLTSNAKPWTEKVDIVLWTPFRAVTALTLMPIKLIGMAVGGILGGLVWGEMGRDVVHDAIDDAGNKVHQGVLFVGEHIKQRIYALGRLVTTDILDGSNNELSKIDQYFKNEVIEKLWPAPDVAELTNLQKFDLALSVLSRSLAAIVVMPVKYLFMGAGGAVGALIGAEKGKQWVQGKIQKGASYLLEGVCTVGEFIKGLITDTARFIWRRAVAIKNHVFVDSLAGIKAELNDAKIWLRTDWPNWITDPEQVVTCFARGVTAIVVKPIEYALVAVGGLLGAIFKAEQGKEWGQAIGIATGELVWEGAMAIGQAFKVFVYETFKFGARRLQALVLNLADAVTGIRYEYAQAKQYFANHQGRKLVKVINGFSRGVAAIVIKPVEYLLAGVGGVLGAIFFADKGKEWGQGIGIGVGELLFEGAVGIGQSVEGATIAVAQFVWERAKAFGQNFLDAVAGIRYEYNQAKQYFANQQGNKFEKVLYGFSRGVAAIVIKPVEYLLTGVGGILGAIFFAENGKEWGQGAGIAVGELLLKGAVGIGTSIAHFVANRGRAVYQHLFVDSKAGAAYEAAQIKDWGRTSQNNWNAAHGWEIVDLYISTSCRCIAAIVVMPLKYALTAVGGLVGALINAREGKELGQSIGIATGELIWAGTLAIGESIKDAVVFAAKFMGRRAMALGSHIMDAGKGIKSEFADFKAYFQAHQGDHWAVKGISVLARGAAAIVIMPIKYALTAVGGTVGAIIGANEGKEWGQAFGIATGELLFAGAVGVGTTIWDIGVFVSKFFRRRGSALVEHVTDIKTGAAKEYKKVTDHFEALSWREQPAGKVIDQAISQFFYAATAIVIMPIKYLFVGIGGALGALILEHRGKEWAQENIAWVGDQVFNGVIAFGGFIKRKILNRLSAVVLLIDAFIGQAFKEIKEAAKHAAEVCQEAWKELRELHIIKGVSIVIVELMAVPAVVAFAVTKFALCGSLGLSGAILGGEASKDRGLAFGRVLSCIPHYFLATIPNFFSTLMDVEEVDPETKETVLVPRDLKTVKDREKLIDIEGAKIRAYLEGTERGPALLAKIDAFSKAREERLQAMRDWWENFKDSLRPARA